MKKSQAVRYLNKMKNDEMFREAYVILPVDRFMIIPAKPITKSFTRKIEFFENLKRMTNIQVDDFIEKMIRDKRENDLKDLT